MKNTDPPVLSQEETQRRANEVISDAVVEKLRELSATEHLRLAYSGLATSLHAHDQLTRRGASQEELEGVTYGVMLTRAYGILAGRAAQVELPPVAMASEDAPVAHDVLGDLPGRKRASRPDHVVDVSRLDRQMDVGRTACQLEVRTDLVTRVVWVDVIADGKPVISLPLATLMQAAS